VSAGSGGDNPVSCPAATPTSSATSATGMRWLRISSSISAQMTGLGNLLAAPFGGYLMCHGAGGLSGHYRFGGRTATAPVLIGLVFLGLGVLLGESGYALLKTIPDAVLGALLLFSGIDLALASKPQSYKDADLFLVLLMAAIGIASDQRPDSSC
jgi:MFS superfamily sulfate permease-like transporter